MGQSSPTCHSYKIHLVYRLDKSVCGCSLNPDHRTFLLLIGLVAVSWLVGLFCSCGSHLFITQDLASLRKTPLPRHPPGPVLISVWLFVPPWLLFLLSQCASCDMVAKEAFLPAPHFFDSYDQASFTFCSLCPARAWLHQFWEVTVSG